MTDLLEADIHHPKPGWALTYTPLGARLIARMNSPLWDTCDTWIRLHQGRGALSRTKPDEWFEPEEMAILPQWLIAELFASANQFDKVVQIIQRDIGVRDHFLKLPPLILDSEQVQWSVINQCFDLARTLMSVRAQDLRD